MKLLRETIRKLILENESQADQIAVLLTQGSKASFMDGWKLAQQTGHMSTSLPSFKTNKRQPGRVQVKFTVLTEDLKDAILARLEEQRRSPGASPIYMRNPPKALKNGWKFDYRVTDK